LKSLTVLLTSSGNRFAPSYIDCLKNNYERRKVRVICTDVFNQPIIQHKADRFYLLPHGRSKKYVDKLIRLCKKEKVDVIIPCSGSETFTISKKINLFHDNGIFPTVSNYNSLKITKYKHKVYGKLKENNIPIPKYFLVKSKKEFKDAIRELGFPKKPICFKPSQYTSSGGGRGFRILRKNNSMGKIILEHKPNSSEIDLKTSLSIFESNTNPQILVMEYVPDHFMGSVYVLANKGRTILCVTISLFEKKRWLCFGCCDSKK